MPKRSSKPKRPKLPADVNRRGKAIVDFLTRDREAEAPAPATAEPPPEPEAKPEKLPAAVELGRRGGLKGGPARAAKLSKEERSEIGKKAARARWGKPSE
jgi:hypothetical protein